MRRGEQVQSGLGLMELPSGCNTKPGHWHSKEEEHLFVLSGVATPRLGAKCFLEGRRLRLLSGAREVRYGATAVTKRTFTVGIR